MSDVVQETVHKILEAVRALLPEFLEDPVDRQMSGGNVSVCIVDASGQVHGQMFGDDPIRKRSTFQTAWRKASQAQITGHATGTFEELVYGRKLDEHPFGISRPDFIGWQGGHPFDVAGARVSVAVSGMRGDKDTELVRRAVARAMGANPAGSSPGR
jgi:glc operon protein GlcG